MAKEWQDKLEIAERQRPYFHYEIQWITLEDGCEEPGADVGELPKGCDDPEMVVVAKAAEPFADRKGETYFFENITRARNALTAANKALKEHRSKK